MNYLVDLLIGLPIVCLILAASYARQKGKIHIFWLVLGLAALLLLAVLYWRGNSLLESIMSVLGFMLFVFLADLLFETKLQKKQSRH